MKCIQKVVILSLKINNQMMGNTFQSIKSDDEKNYIILDVVFSKLHDYGTKERVNSG